MGYILRDAFNWANVCSPNILRTPPPPHTHTHTHSTFQFFLPLWHSWKYKTKMGLEKCVGLYHHFFSGFNVASDYHYIKFCSLFSSSFFICTFCLSGGRSTGNSSQGDQQTTPETGTSVTAATSLQLLTLDQHGFMKTTTTTTTTTTHTHTRDTHKPPPLPLPATTTTKTLTRDTNHHQNNNNTQWHTQTTTKNNNTQWQPLQQQKTS